MELLKFIGLNLLTLVSGELRWRAIDCAIQLEDELTKMSTSWPNEDELTIGNIAEYELTENWERVDQKENELT